MHSYGLDCSLSLRVLQNFDRMDLFDRTDSPAPVLRHVREMATVARRELGDDADHVEMVKMLEKWSGTELHP